MKTAAFLRGHQDKWLQGQHPIYVDFNKVMEAIYT